jgi:hypothetical protein
MADINTLAQYAPSTYFEWFFELLSTKKSAVATSQETAILMQVRLWPK